MTSKLESKILCRELGRLAGPIAGIGARWAAKRLPSVEYSERASANITAEALFGAASALLREMGRELPEFQPASSAYELSAMLGSGIKNLNPTLVFIGVAPRLPEPEIHLRAVAKEGAIPQASAELAVKRFMTALRERLPNNSLKTDGPDGPRP